MRSAQLAHKNLQILLKENFHAVKSVSKTILKLANDLLNLIGYLLLKPVNELLSLRQLTLIIRLKVFDKDDYSGDHRLGHVVADNNRVEMLDNAIFALLRQVKVLLDLCSDVLNQLSPATKGLVLVLNDSFSSFIEFRKVEVTS